MQSEGAKRSKEKEERREEQAYAYWLHNVPGIGDKTAVSLFHKIGGARAVYHASEKQLQSVLAEKQVKALLESRNGWKVQENYEKMTEKKIRMVYYGEREYPKKLRKIDTPPFVLYYLGRLPEEKDISLALIGARECSDYGSVMAKAFAGQLAAKGINIISGMARGIDGIGQMAALEAGGKTFAVLGCGVDICYPASNQKLYEEIQSHGGILSSYPPGQKPTKMLFPYRNKIVAGLSDGVLVIEARQKSGTLITVDMALEQGKDVYAVPGRLTDRLSDGCNYLIRQGAGIALTPEDVLRELTILNNRQGEEGKQTKKEKSKKQTKATKGEGQEETAKSEKQAESETDRKETNQKETNQKETGVLQYLDLHPVSSDIIFEKVKQTEEEMTYSQLMFELIQLCMMGKAKQVGGNYFVKVIR